MSRWRIELLGGVRATRDGLSVTRFRTHKAEALLGLLAFRRDRPQPRELLTEMLWPDSEPGVGRNNLSRELSSLRHLLEPPGVRPGSVVVAGRTTVHLEGVTTDVAELDDALARATGPGRIEALRAAIALHAGELLPGHYQEWVEPERVRLRGAVVRAARDLGAALAAAGDPAGAIEALRRAIGADPLAEEAHRELMALHTDADDPAAALRLFAELEARLRRELGVAPAPATTELARRLRERGPRVTLPVPPAARRPRPGLVTLLALSPDDPAAYRRHDGVARDGVGVFQRPADALACALAARGPTTAAALDTALEGSEGWVKRLLADTPPGTLLVSERTAPLLAHDLGADLRLVDLGRFSFLGTEERLFRIEGQGLAAGRPRVGPVNPALPLELTRLVGREQLLAELSSQLAGRTRLLTITGPGGMGKTRLALELARGRRGGLWFVPLAAVTDPARIGEAVADAMELPRPAGLDEVVRALSSWTEQRDGLLVLDNLEQLGDGAAPVVRELLERAPGCSVLATSRRRLGIAGEREEPLGPLPVEAGVELFVDRVRAVRPDFQRTDEDAAALAELVRRLDGVPLALTLAAGRAQVLSPAQLLERLGEGFALLVSRAPDVPERHRTLAAALTWSTDLLADERRLLFARLTVFRGPFRLEAAEAVTRDPLVLDALSELRECSLLLAGGDGRGGVLFRLLDTIRELAAPSLAPDELAELERRHAEHYRALADEAEPLLHGPGGREWFRRLGDEYGNLRAVLERGATTPALAPVALGLARGLRSYWFGAGPARDVAALLPPLLAAAPARTADRAAALWALGLHLARSAPVEQSRPWLEESLAIWRELGNGPMATGVIMTLAEALSRAGEDSAARARYEEGLSLARASGDTRRLAWGLGALGQHLLFQDELALARPLIDEAIALNEGRDVPQHAIEQWRLAELLFAQGETDEATALAGRALETLAGLGFESNAAQCRALLGRARARAGDAPGARALLTGALAVFREGERPDYLAMTLLDLADVALQAGDRATAASHLQECKRLVRASCEHLFLDRLLLLEGDLARLAGDLAGARARYEAARAHVETRRGWGRGRTLAGLAAATAAG